MYEATCRLLEYSDVSPCKEGSELTALKQSSEDVTIISRKLTWTASMHIYLNAMTKHEENTLTEESAIFRQIICI